MNKTTKKARLAIHEWKLLDACLICILIFVFFLQSTQPEARAKKNSAVAGVAVHFTGEKEKKAHLLVI